MLTLVSLKKGKKSVVAWTKVVDQIAVCTTVPGKDINSYLSLKEEILPKWFKTFQLKGVRYIQVNRSMEWREIKNKLQQQNAQVLHMHCKTSVVFASTFLFTIIM